MDGPPPQEEDFSQIAIADRLAHKNWKARLSGYESLIKIFQNTTSDTDPAFRPYLSNPETLKKIATDANAVSQEKGIEALLALVKFAGETAAKTRETIVPTLVDKCFGSTRAATKGHALELCLQYVEVENTGSGVTGDIIPGLSAKQPKVVAGCVMVIRETIRLFGPQVVPPPPLLKSLPKIFLHTDKSVRAEGTSLAHTLYRCIGAGIDPWLADLKPVQIKELREAFEKMDSEGNGKGTWKPERFTRAQAREVEAGGGQETEDISPEDLNMSSDPRTFAEEVDIVPRLPSALQAALSSSKWKERKEVLDDLAMVLNSTPRVKDAPELGEVARGLAGRMGDANVNCVIAAAVCMEALAKGMMGSFARFRETVVPPMLERLKERKQSVTDAIGLALDSVFATTTIPDILPDILQALTSKNPQVKEGTMKFLSRSLTSTTTPPAQPQVKLLSEALAALLEDSFEGARNEAAICLGTLMKIVGERPLNAIMDQLPEVRKVKVKEAFEKASVRCKVGAGGPQKPPSRPAGSAKLPALQNKAAPMKMAGETLSNSSPIEPDGQPVNAKPPARLLAKKLIVSQDSGEHAIDTAPKPVVKPSTTRFAAKKSAPPATATSSAKPSKVLPLSAGSLDTFKYKHTPEDADGLATDIIPSAIATALTDPNWKIRLAALEEMATWVDGVVEDIDSEVVVRFLGKKGCNEKNFQVSARLYTILITLAERCPSFGRSSVALAIPHLSEKLGDMKLKKPAGETLITFAEKTSLQFVLAHMYEPLSKQKAPKVLADSLNWIESALTDFGVAGLSLRSLIDFLKTALGNSNAAVRTSATKTLVTVKLFVGASVKELLGDLNPQLAATIHAEFDKAEDKPAPEPSRTSADTVNIVHANVAGKGAAGADPMDDLFPRVDVDGLLKGSTILADAKSDAWKVKKEALEALQAILDQGSNKRLKGNMGEIGQVLKARVTDTNKAVQLLALVIVGRIATGMGKPFEKQTRFFALPVATVLADQKSNIRLTALQTLSAIADACEGLDSMVHGLSTALESSNPLQRSSLLNWIAEWFKEHETNPALDLTSWAGPVVSCLDDRSADVRKGAQAVLPYIITQTGFSFVMQQTNSLKPASRATVIPLLKAAAAASPHAEILKTTTVAPPPIHAPVQHPTPPPAASTHVPSSSPPPGPIKGPVSKLAGVRRKLPQGSIPRPESRTSNVDDVAPSRLPAKTGFSGLKKPTPVAISSTRGGADPAPVASISSPFNALHPDTKKARLAKDNGRWVIESGPVRKDLVELLQNQMESHASRDLIGLLFSHDHNAVNDHVAGLGMMCDFYSDLSSDCVKYGLSRDDRLAVGLANADLALKYVSLRIHEPQPNLISKCLDVIEHVTAFYREVDCQLTDSEAMCFVPTIMNKLGDAREAVRIRVQQIIQTLPKVYAYSRIFQLLLDHGLKSKVAKTRQGALEELTGILKRNGISACDPAKSFPVISSMISDKDAQVRKAALSVLCEGYALIGDRIWSLVGRLTPKDKTQLEERLRRVAAPNNLEDDGRSAHPPASNSRLNSDTGRSGSPAPHARLGSIPRPASPAIMAAPQPSHPPSPSRAPTLGLSNGVYTDIGRPDSPARVSRLPSSIAGPSSPAHSTRPKSFLPSRLGPQTRPNIHYSTYNETQNIASKETAEERPVLHTLDGNSLQHSPPEPPAKQPEPLDEHVITLTISKILSSDASRSVEALKQIQKVLEITPEDGPSSHQYRELSDHTEGLIDTITLQMSHVFENMATVAEPENFRLAKHLIQTLNAFCDHALLAESLQVDILTALMEELTLRLLQTDESSNSKVKDLSRFINMIILRLFVTCRRMTVIRSLFTLLLQIVKPFPSTGTLPDSKDAKVAELVLKCIWKLARNIPSDLEKQELDPVELFPAIEHFLQSIPPNEWRARATNKVPSGDMPLRTIKVIIQHVVAHYGDEVYDLLSSSFDDPSATIVYPYVFRILNTSRANTDANQLMTNGNKPNQHSIYTDKRPTSPRAASSLASVDRRNSSPSQRTSRSMSSTNGAGVLLPPVQEPDPDEQLLTIINHISSETTGAMHKEGVTELHHFLKAYPHKKPRVDRMLESTGPAFRKYIARALASRAAEDEERNVAVADTLSKLESKRRDTPLSSSTIRNSGSPQSPRRSSNASDVPAADRDKLTRLHDIFHYRASTTSNGSSSHAGPDGSPLSSTKASGGS